MRRLLLTIALVLTLFSPPAHAEEPSVVFFEDFNSEAAFDSWEGGFCSTGESEGFICAVPNGFSSDYGQTVHLLSHVGSISLSGGQVYKISFSVKSLSSNARGPVASSMALGEGNKNIVFRFWNIPEKPVRASAFFILPADGSYGFSLELMDGDPDLGFVLDNIKIETVNLVPDRTVITGQSRLTIPASGEESFRFGAAAYAENEAVNLPLGSAPISVGELPAGVSFNPSDATVTVSEGCPDEASFTLTCTPSAYLSLEPVSLEITLTKNVLQNSDFTYGADGWIIDSDYNLGGDGSCLSLSTEQPSQHGFSASITPERPVVLIGGEMYVFRAKVRVESGSDSSVYSQNTALMADNTVDIEILNLSAGDWCDVIAAFTPEVSGIYDIRLSFVTSEPGLVSVSAMTLSPEVPDETFITLHAPGNICVPDTETDYPFNAFIRDQAGEIMGGRCDLRLYPEGRGVELSGGKITVSPDAIAGEYEIYAVSRTHSGVESSLMLTVSHSNIGDGGFEEKSANEWWAAASPAVLTIEGCPDGKYGKITSDADFAVILNNSYMHLYANLPYAFRADVTEGESSTVTAFIETVDGERFPAVQSKADGGKIFELFQTETELVGRLMLYITSDGGEGVELGLDNIELFRSILTASAPTVSGLADSGSVLSVSFDFYNNMDPSADASDCIISWYSLTASGEAEYIGSGSELTVAPSLVGRYVYAEVVPICAITGLSGFAVQSVPLAIGTLRTDDIPSDIPDTSEPESSAPTLTPVRLAEAAELPFTDMNHWAAEYIAPLYSAGIVSGKAEAYFCPNDRITRAEFAAAISRAFGAKGGARSFADVPADAWYSDSVSALAELGIIKGVSDEAFSPDAFLTREQLLSVLVRIYEKLAGEADIASLSRFYDREDISAWAEAYAAKGLAIGLINGTEQSTLLPKREASRAEAFTMLYRLLKLLEDI